MDRIYIRRPPWKARMRRPHSLHKMMSRPGSMPPALARYFIEMYSSPGGLVLDPFCGKGTVLLEACLLGRKAIGFDVAPDAALVASAKVNPPTVPEIQAFLNTMEHTKRAGGSIPWQVRAFFSPSTLFQLLDARDRLLDDISNGHKSRRRTATFLLGTLLGILHGHSRLTLSLSCSHSFAMAPKYVRSYARRHGLRRPSRDVKGCLLARAKELLSDSAPSGLGAAYLASAESYPRVEGKDLKGSVDLIVTSPPYLDVQTYAKDAWLRLWLLGYDYKDMKPRFIETGSPRTYLERMAPCMAEMLRVLRPSAHAVIVAGDAPYRVGAERRFFRTAEELGALAGKLTLAGYKLKSEGVMVDNIPAHARYYSCVHKDGGSDGDDAERKGVRLERIIVMKKVNAT
jgi:SAM-dependent methyltransferase